MNLGAAVLGVALIVSPAVTPQDLLPPETVPLYTAASAKVAKLGWTCIAVGGDRTHKGFAYTMGLSSRGLPELGVFEAVDTNDVCVALKKVLERMLARGRAPRDGETMFEMPGMRLVVREIEPEEFFERCIFADVWRKTHAVTNARGMQLVELGTSEQMPP